MNTARDYSEMNEDVRKMMVWDGGGGAGGAWGRVPVRRARLRRLAGRLLLFLPRQRRRPVPRPVPPTAQGAQGVHPCSVRHAARRHVGRPDPDAFKNHFRDRLGAGTATDGLPVYNHSDPYQRDHVHELRETEAATAAGDPAAAALH